MTARRPEVFAPGLISPIRAARHAFDPARSPKAQRLPAGLSEATRAAMLEMETRARRRALSALGPVEQAKRVEALRAAGVPVRPLGDDVTVADLSALELYALDCSADRTGRGRPRASAALPAIIFAALEDERSTARKPSDVVPAVCRRLGVSRSQISKAERHIRTRNLPRYPQDPERVAEATARLISEARDVLAASERQIASAFNRPATALLRLHHEPRPNSIFD